MHNASTIGMAYTSASNGRLWCEKEEEKIDSRPLCHTHTSSTSTLLTSSILDTWRIYYYIFPNMKLIYRVIGIQNYCVCMCVCMCVAGTVARERINNPLCARNRGTMPCATHVSANVFAFIAFIRLRFRMELVSPFRFQSKRKTFHFHHRRFSRQNVISDWELMSHQTFGMSPDWVSGAAIRNSLWSWTATCFIMHRTAHIQRHTYTRSGRAGGQREREGRRLFCVFPFTQNVPPENSERARRTWNPFRTVVEVKPTQNTISITDNGSEYPKPIQLSNKISYQFFIVYARCSQLAQ